MRDQTNAIREQVSFKQREEHIRDSWNFLCSHYHLNKSDLVKFLIKKEEYFLRRPETIPSGFIKDWLWVLKSILRTDFFSLEATVFTGPLSAWDLLVSFVWEAPSWWELMNPKI